MEVGNGSLGFNKNTTDKKLTKKVENLEKRIEEIEEGNIDVNLDEYAKKEDLPSKTSELTNDSNFADEKYVDDAIDFLEKIQLSDEMPTDENVTIWINTSEDTANNPLARVNDEIVSNEHTWSSEKIYQHIMDLTEKYNDLLIKYNELLEKVSNLQEINDNCLQDINGDYLQDMEGNYLIFKESV